jgi:hypothetical protein
MSNQKVHFTLSDEALAIIAKRATSTNKRGEWISQAIVDYDHVMAGVATDAIGDVGLLEQIATRMARLEKQMLALLAKNI